MRNEEQCARCASVAARVVTAAGDGPAYGQVGLLWPGVANRPLAPLAHLRGRRDAATQRRHDAIGYSHRQLKTCSTPKRKISLVLMEGSDIFFFGTLLGHMCVRDCFLLPDLK